MKEIMLKIDDDVFTELKTQLGLSIMMESAYGIQDSFMAKLIKSIEENKKEIHLEFKK